MLATGTEYSMQCSTHLLVIVAITLVRLPASIAESFCDLGKGWHRVFSDDFEGSTLNDAVWTRQAISKFPCLI